MRSLFTILLLGSIVTIASGTVMVYPTDIGKVQIDVPYTLVPGGISNGYSLQLGLNITPNSSFPSIDWAPVFSIDMHNSSIEADNMDALASDYMGEGNKYEEMFTDDGQRMRFYAITNEDGRTNHYYGFIDHITDKKCVVEIDANSEVYYFKPIAYIGKVEFQNVCKSFAFL
jgi:hypothetical protein